MLDNNYFGYFWLIIVVYRRRAQLANSQRWQATRTPNASIAAADRDIEDNVPPKKRSTKPKLENGRLENDKTLSQVRKSFVIREVRLKTIRA